jgi:hypothetical protein
MLPDTLGDALKERVRDDDGDRLSETVREAEIDGD